jgi:hypothetical protein|tara:strand:+ start:303 stop:1487 length:1185 start_codon:yes stop_codon:yes gene_type:complete
MNIKNTHKEQIVASFTSLKTKEDLLDLLNYVNELMYGQDFKPLTSKGLNYYANPKNTEKRYTSFTIKKKSGGERTIHAPVKGLKHILKPLNVVFNCVAEPHAKATGFVPGKSIVDNAKMHVGNQYVYNIDLKDFFHSFDRNRVKMGLWYSFFELIKEMEPLAFLMASLCTHPFEIDGKVQTVLPQGAPTSPTITNILCLRLDRRLNGLAKRFKIKYSRYADDITFSSDTNVFRKDQFINELHRIIQEDDLVLNKKKTRLQQAGYRQEVTGLIVNTKVNVNSRYIKQLRMWLYYWEKYGFEKAESIFLRDYGNDKGHVKNGKPDFRNVLSGKLEYLKMVKGQEDSTYLALNNRFEKLSVTTTKTPLNKAQKENIYSIVDQIFEKGIDEALKNYKI